MLCGLHEAAGSGTRIWGQPTSKDRGRCPLSGGPSAGLLGQMFLGVSHCHLWVHDPGPWQESLPCTLKISGDALGCAFKWLMCTVEFGSQQPHF